VKNAKKHKGSLVWTYDFDWKEGKAKLKKPWISAMSQGLAISVLSRAYIMTKDKKFLNAACGASSVFFTRVEDGGVMTGEDDYIYYEEYPAKPYPRILDGFIFSLLGLYDLYSVKKNEKIDVAFKSGIKTLEKNLSKWDFLGLWSRYGLSGLLSSKDYNDLNCLLLRVLFGLTRSAVFYDYSKRWGSGGLVKNMFVSAPYVLMVFKSYLERSFE